MLSSEARTLPEEVTPDLQFAGIAIDALPNDSTYLDTCADLAESR